MDHSVFLMIDKGVSIFGDKLDAFDAQLYDSLRSDNLEDVGSLTKYSQEFEPTGNEFSFTVYFKDHSTGEEKSIDVFYIRSELFLLDEETSDSKRIFGILHRNLPILTVQLNEWGMSNKY